MPRKKRLGKRVLTDYIRVQSLTDSQLRKLLNETASEAARLIRSYESQLTISAAVRRLQLRLAAEQLRMWIDIEDHIKDGMNDSATVAARLATQFDRQYLENLGIDVRAWERSLIETAKRGVNSLISRDENGISLSRKIYKNRQLASGRIDSIISRDLLLGKNAKEIARDVSGFIRPDVPGGVSYAAFRLGRTELNNAFHRTSTRSYEETPWIETVRWNISGSHPKPDICDDYAKKIHFKGGQPGQFNPSDVPTKPHPQCLCYIEPETITDQEFISSYLKGDYENYIDSVLK